MVSGISAPPANTSIVDTCKGYIPEPDEFIAVESMPEFDYEEMLSKVVCPKDARNRDISGRVVVAVLVACDGEAKKAFAIQWDDVVLKKVAEEAVLAIRFKPAIQNGIAVACWVSIPVEFKPH